MDFNVKRVILTSMIHIPEAHISRYILAILLGVLILQLGNGLFTTLLGLRMSLDGFSDSTIGFITAAFYSGMAAGTLYCKPIIERIGHIRTFSAFASLLSAAAILHVFYVNPVAWGILRMMSGFCMAALFMVAESWLSSASNNANRGKVLSAYLITTYVAMGSGQFLLKISDPSHFVLFGLVSVIISLSLVPIALTRAPAPTLPETTPFSVQQLLKISPLGLLGSLCSGMVLGAFWGLTPTFAKQVGINIDDIGALMAAVVYGSLLFQWPVGILADRTDRRNVLVLLCIVGTLSGSALMASTDANILYLSLFGALFGAATGPIYSVSVAYANDYTDNTDYVAVTSGLLLAYGVGAIIGPLFASAIMELTGPQNLFLYMAMVHVGLALYTVYRKTQREVSTDDHSGSVTPLPRTSAIATNMVPLEDTDPIQPES